MIKLKFCGIFYPYVRKSKYEHVTHLHIDPRRNKKQIFLKSNLTVARLKQASTCYECVCHENIT